MCVIIYLEKNQKIPKEYLYNAVYNNCHGFGMLVQQNKKNKLGYFDFDLITIEPVNEEIDPNEVEKSIEKYESHNRWIHLRNATAGGVNVENVQPFEITCKNKDHKLWLMHNGTIVKYKKYVNMHTGEEQNYLQQGVSQESPFSDTYWFSKDFVEHLIDLNNDYSHEMFVKFFEQEVGQSIGNRLVLISNYQEHQLYKTSSWDILQRKDHPLMGEEEKILVSNLDYFKELKRGPEYDRRKKAEEEERKRNLPAVSTTFSSSNSSTVTQLSKYDEALVTAYRSTEIDLNKLFSCPMQMEDFVYGLSSESTILDIATELELVYDAVANCTLEEVQDWIKGDIENCSKLMMRMAVQYCDLIERLRDLEDIVQESGLDTIEG